MLHLYIVRHGETEWNKDDRIQGRLNSNLTNKGRSNAERLSKKLHDIHFSRIISSPSQRASDTAKIIRGNRDLEIETDDRIMEMCLGPWQGLTLQEIQMQFPVEYDCYINRPHEYKLKDAETFIDLYKRASHFLQDLTSCQKDGNVLVVTHGLFIKSLFMIFKGMLIRDIWQESTVDGTSLTVVKLHEDTYELVLEGDMSHV